MNMTSSTNKFFGFFNALFGEHRPGQRTVQVVDASVAGNGSKSESAVAAPAAKKVPARRPGKGRSVRPFVPHATFAPGQILSATVKRVDEAVAYFSVRGASSVVLSANACEKGGAVAFSDLAVGQRVRVRAKAWYPQTRQIVLDGVEGSISSEKVQEAHANPRPAKPEYEPLAKGTVVLVDGANLLGEFEPAEAANVLRSLSVGLKEQGYEAQIYLEHRARTFLIWHQGTEEAGEAFKALCRELDVVPVDREADLAILQTLSAIPNSVAVTNDRYRDYAKAFPELVGTPRLRQFTVACIGGKKLISVDGLARAITVAAPGGVAETDGAAVERTQEATALAEEAPSEDIGYGGVLLAQGQMRGAIRCFEKDAARKRPEGYAGLAEICVRRGDVKKAAKYVALGEKLRRRLRDQKLRCRRLKAEWRRANHAVCGQFA